MSSYILAAGTFDLILVGNASGTLSPLNVAPGTGGYQISEDTPRSTFIYASGSYEQDGNSNIILEMKFISEDDTFVKLARGFPLSAAHGDVYPSPNQQYSFVLYNSFSQEDSIWIPKCESECKWNLDRQKQKQNETVLRFRYQQGYDNSIQLFYKRSNAVLAALVGANWPSGY